jgi:hypothetical protein
VLFSGRVEDAPVTGRVEDEPVTGRVEDAPVTGVSKGPVTSRVEGVLAILGTGK